MDFTSFLEQFTSYQFPLPGRTSLRQADYLFDLFPTQATVFTRRSSPRAE